MTTPARAHWTVCTAPGCPTIHNGQGKCPDCERRARAQQDKRRRPAGNPYANHGHQAFRNAVLDRDPICVVCNLAPSVVADHHPVERVDLIAQGLDPNDAQYGRGCCKACHDQKAGSMYGWGTR